MSANDLISGYTAYTSAEELAVEPMSTAPEATASVTPSTAVCFPTTVPINPPPHYTVLQGC